MKKLLYVGMLAIVISYLLASCVANDEMANTPMYEKKEVALTTSLDFSSCKTFMDENLTYSGNLILDCSDLVYISSAGLRVLLSLQKKRTAGMKLIHVGELVREVFEMTGFIDILTIE